MSQTGLTEVPALSNQISRPAGEKTRNNQTFQFSESENVEKQYNKKDIFVIIIKSMKVTFTFLC